MLESIDAVLVINLKERTDKWDDMYAHLQLFFPENKIHRIEAVRGTQVEGYGEKPWFTERSEERATICAGAAGCTLSHKRAIEYAKRHHFKKVLVLEDDCHLQEDVRSIPGEALALLSSDTRGGIMYLGCHHTPKIAYRCEKYGERSLFAISGALGSYAFILDSRAYDSLLAYFAPEDKAIWEWIATHKAIDQWLYKEYNQLGSIFAFYPQLVDILPSCSDIAQKEVHYDIDADFVPFSLSTREEFDRKMKWHLAVESVLRPMDNGRRWLNCRLWGYPKFRRKG